MRFAVLDGGVAGRLLLGGDYREEDDGEGEAHGETITRSGLGARGSGLGGFGVRRAGGFGHLRSLLRVPSPEPRVPTERPTSSRSNRG